MQNRSWEDYFYQVSLKYLERYEATQQMLMRVLKRKMMRLQFKGILGADTALSDVIQKVVERLNEKGYLNDGRYSENKVRQWALAGKSKRYIMQKLYQQGLSAVAVEQALATEEALTESERLYNFIRKRHLVFTPETYQKNLGVLARAGFSYDTIQEVLGQDDAKAISSI